MCNKEILDLFTSRAKYCFLAGAGISIDAPSCLPGGHRFSETVLEKVVPIGEKSKILSLMDTGRKSAKALGDFLRFEELMELIQQEMDPELLLLTVFKLCNTPNLGHRFLANLLLNGHKIMTTNFDSLIEYALLELNSDADSFFPIIDRDEWETANLQQELPAIYKLHGSLFHVRDRRDCRETVQATISRISENKNQSFCLESWKQIVVEHMLQIYDLVVIGYSGLDDLDIMPTLMSIPSKKRLLWIEYHEGVDLDHAIIENGSDFTTTQIKTNRVLQNLKRFVDLGTRPAKNIYYIRADTTLLIEGLWEKFLQVDLPDHEDCKGTPTINLSHLNPNEAQKWILAGQIYHDRNDNDRSLRCYERGLEEAITIGETVCQLHCLIGLAHAQIKLGRAQEAMKRFDEVIGLADRAGEMSFKAIALNEVGMDQFNRGLVDDAIDTLQEAYALVGHKTLLRLRARTLNNLALTYLKKRHLIEASRHIDEAIALNREIGDLRALSTNLGNLALYYSQKRDLQKALATYDELLDLSEQLGDISKKTLALSQKGLLYKYKGDFQLALQFYRKALTVSRLLDMPEQKVGLLLNMTLLLNEMRKPDEGLACCKDALEELTKIDRPEFEASILHLKAIFFHNKRRFKEAEQAFQSCIEIYKCLDYPGRHSNVLSDFAFLLHDMGRDDDAIDIVHQAKEIAVRIGDSRIIEHARQVEKVIRLSL